MIDFTPMNALEHQLKAVQAGRCSMLDFLRLFNESDIALPSAGEVLPDGSGFRPLLFDKEGVQMMACFTAMERIGNFASIAPYCLMIRGDELLQRIPADYGLVVNPGRSVGFDVTPDGLRKIAADLA